MYFLYVGKMLGSTASVDEFGLGGGAGCIQDASVLFMLK
jgi:hypothetical protein